MEDYPTWLEEVTKSLASLATSTGTEVGTLPEWFLLHDGPYQTALTGIRPEGEHIFATRISRDFLMLFRERGHSPEEAAKLLWAYRETHPSNLLDYEYYSFSLRYVEALSLARAAWIAEAPEGRRNIPGQLQNEDFSALQEESVGEEYAVRSLRHGRSVEYTIQCWLRNVGLPDEMDDFSLWLDAAADKYGHKMGGVVGALPAIASNLDVSYPSSRKEVEECAERLGIPEEEASAGYANAVIAYQLSKLSETGHKFGHQSEFTATAALSSWPETASCYVIDGHTVSGVHDQGETEHIFFKFESVAYAYMRALRMAFDVTGVHASAAQRVAWTWPGDDGSTYERHAVVLLPTANSISHDNSAAYDRMQIQRFVSGVRPESSHFHGEV